MRKNRQKSLLVFVAIVIAAISPAKVLAQTSSSPNYRVDQTIFGSGGELDASSSSYRSRQTAGELTIGQTESLNYRAFAGYNTTDEPYIEFVVTADDIDLGYLDTTQASTATGTFYVRAWQASGYSVVTASDPPTNTGANAQQLNALATPTASSPGTEQFGINLKDNATPDVGSEPLQSPDSSFSFGVPATGYDTPDSFKYVKGDVIAASGESSSVTIYTISYLFNIDNATPSGQYVFNHVLVATGTY